MKNQEIIQKLFGIYEILISVIRKLNYGTDMVSISSRKEKLNIPFL